MRNQHILADLDRLDMQASQLYEDIESLISTKVIFDVKLLFFRSTYANRFMIVQRASVYYGAFYKFDYCYYSYY